MEIKSGVGLGKLVLGMTQEEVIKALGDADQINDLDEESDQYIIYYYYDDEVKLYFDKDKNYRLLSIETFNKTVSFLNVNIIDMRDNDLRTLLFRNKLKYEVEEYPNFHIVYIPSRQIFLNVELDRVRSVEIQPMVKDKKVVWPKR